MASIGVRTRKIAVIVTDGVNGKTAMMAAQALMAKSAVVRLVGPHIGLMQSESGDTLDVDSSTTRSPPKSSAFCDTGAIAS